MSSFTVTPSLSTAVMTIRIDHNSTVTGVERADANGTRPVRTRGIFPVSGAGSFSIADYEAALSGRVVYRVFLTSGTLTVDTTFDSPSRVQSPRFILPTVPQHSVAVDNVMSYDEEQQTGSTIHEVIDRPDPLVILGKLRTRRGNLEMVIDSYRETRALRSVLYEGSVVLFRQTENAGQDVYFVPLNYKCVADPDSDTWRVTVGFVEVDYPTGNIRSTAGWTFTALKTDQASFSDVARNYETFVNLEVKEKR